MRLLAETGVALASVRVDATNAFPTVDAALRHFDALGVVFGAVEEPLRVDDFEGLQALAARLGMPIVLESALRADDLDLLAVRPRVGCRERLALAG